MYAWLAEPYMVASHCDTMNSLKKQLLNTRKKQQKIFSPYCNIPVHTRDTAGTGSGMPRYAKVQHHTRTRTTRLGNTAGFSVPVPNPSQDKTQGPPRDPDQATF